MSLNFPVPSSLFGQLLLKLQDPALRGGEVNSGREQELAPHPTPGKQAGQEPCVSLGTRWETLGDRVGILNELASHRGKERAGQTSRQLEESLFLISSGNTIIQPPHLPTLASTFQCIPDHRRYDMQTHIQGLWTPPVGSMTKHCYHHGRNGLVTWEPCLVLSLSSMYIMVGS